MTSAIRFARLRTFWDRSLRTMSDNSNKLISRVPSKNKTKIPFLSRSTYLRVWFYFGDSTRVYFAKVIISVQNFISTFVTFGEHRKPISGTYRSGNVCFEKSFRNHNRINVFSFFSPDSKESRFIESKIYVVSVRDNSSVLILRFFLDRSSSVTKVKKKQNKRQKNTTKSKNL